jgi:hypothetical protein
VGSEPVTSLLHVVFITTAPQTHIHPYVVFILLILYYTECQMLFWDSKHIQIKDDNYKISELSKIYNFYFGSFSIRGRLQNFNFKFERFKLSFFVKNMISNKKLYATNFISFKIYNY